MKIYFDDVMYKAVKITGPSHNILGLILKIGLPSYDPEMVDIDNEKEGTRVISSEKLKRQVLDAINDVNREFALNYYPIKIEYSGFDTFSETIYKELATEIVKSIIRKN